MNSLAVSPFRREDGPHHEGSPKGPSKKGLHVAFEESHLAREAPSFAGQESGGLQNALHNIQRSGSLRSAQGDRAQEEADLCAIELTKQRQPFAFVGGIFRLSERSRSVHGESGLFVGARIEGQEFLQPLAVGIQLAPTFGERLPTPHPAQNPAARSQRYGQIPEGEEREHRDAIGKIPDQRSDRERAGEKSDQKQNGRHDGEYERHQQVIAGLGGFERGELSAMSQSRQRSARDGTGGSQDLGDLVDRHGEKR